MTTHRYPHTTSQELERGWRFGWVDLLVLAGIFAILWSLVVLGGDMRAQFDELNPPKLDLDPAMIPYYTARTVLRMLIAFVAALGFTFAWGYAAAKSRRARRFMLPIIDVLQSVPVLGFLSVTVTGFIALFPGSLLGVECAAIFAIFTAQAWNMTFGFYHSLVTIPPELGESARVYRLNAWQRFTTLELPASAIGLIWNSMMSFGGGWFFVAQSEAISVMNHNIKLPGLGSYMAAAVEAGDTRAAGFAIAAMIITIVTFDQLVWRPLIAWAEKFKIEQSEARDTPTSWFLELLQNSYAAERIADAVGALFSRATRAMAETGSDVVDRFESSSTPFRTAIRAVAWIIGGALLIWLAHDALGIVREIRTELTPGEMLHIVWLGVLTFLRVAVMTVLATLVWTPIGVWIGLRPRVARIAQPLAQIAASFPVNMTFPVVVGLFVAISLPMNVGSVFLMALGTQWYILFNVIAGAMAIPSDLVEASTLFGLGGWRLWKTLIIPAIFPFWVTGAVTAAGGAWNASIVAEVATWGKTKLVADGLGAYIAEVTERGDTPAIYFSIVVMSVFVVGLNRGLWRRLYDLAEDKFRLA